MTPQQKLELLLDLVADKLIQDPNINTTDVELNQKFIRNGLIQIGQEGGGTLALFQKDIEANQEDLNLYTELDENGESIPVLQNIANSITDFNTLVIEIFPSQMGENTFLQIKLSSGGLSSDVDITPYISGNGNPLNVSQFIPLEQQQSIVDVEKAEEFLDTNIFELLSSGDDRQDRINKFFQELNALLPPELPEFDLDGDGSVDREEETNNWIGAEEYSQNNSISYAQDNPAESNIDEQNAFIHRLESTANPTNSSRTIEDIYNRVVPYLRDVLEDDGNIGDDREEYQNQSSGYLQFRNPNQGIIVRNTNQEFIDGLNPDPDQRGFLDTGFTITMWVKFLDKSSKGTLFNFANPTRDNNPFGFKLETYVIDGDDVPTDENGNFVTGFGAPAGSTWKDIFQDGNPLGLTWDGGPGSEPAEGFFSQTNSERFVRLVVWDNIQSNVGRIRGSHIGKSFMNRRAGLPQFPELYNGYDVFTDTGIGQYDHCYGLMTNVRIPQDFNEWYFICASFNPSIEEDESHNFSQNNNYYDVYKNNSNFWLNHINPLNGSPAVESEFGNQCKVEIISRTDLLRARGFKV